VPRGWLGVQADGPLTEQPATFAGEWDLMTSSGVENVRVAFSWREMQPVAGGPISFAATDGIVAAAAARRLPVLPVVHRTPTWAAAKPGQGAAAMPRGTAGYTQFLTALVGRYGPSGSLWAEQPALPRMAIRDWQIWNEPNITRYWSEQPFARSYVRLLRAAQRALRAADHGVTVVLAGLPNMSWKALRAIYRAGGRGHFDAVALHPYTGKPADVLRLVRYARRVMRAHGDRRIPIWITELSWPAAAGKLPQLSPFAVSDASQARRLGKALDLLSRARKRRRIERVFWYTWLSAEVGPSAFDWSGLRRLRGGTAVDAPALAEFRRWARRLEGCAKTADARRCA